MVSDLTLLLAPNPLPSGSEADLTVEAAGEDPVGGAGALWQCWTGSEWESTHQILRPIGAGVGEPRVIAPGTEPTVPAVGLPVPNTYRVTIPEVPAGIYRIIDEVWVGGQSRRGLTIVIVEDPGDSG